MNASQLAGLMMGEKVVVTGYGDSRYDGRTATVQRTVLDMVLVCFEGSGSEYGFPSCFLEMSHDDLLPVYGCRCQRCNAARDEQNGNQWHEGHEQAVNPWQGSCIMCQTELPKESTDELCSEECRLMYQDGLADVRAEHSEQHDPRRAMASRWGVPHVCDHEWHKQRVGGPPDDAGSLEVVIYCKLCGRERQEYD